MAGKDKRAFGVEPGTKGFLVSCFRGREAACVSECYQLLDQYYDKFYGSSCAEGNPKKRDFSVLIEDELEAELAEMRKKKDKTFLSLPMGDLQCLAYLRLGGKTAQVKPSVFAVQMFESLLQEGKAKARYSQRIIPIDYSCYANLTDFSKLAKVCIEEHFPVVSPSGNATTYCLAIESRFNNSISKEEIIQAFTQMVPSAYKVQFKVPDLTVVVQVFKNIVGFSVVPKYDALKRFNVQQCVRSSESAPLLLPPVENAE